MIRQLKEGKDRFLPLRHSAPAKSGHWLKPTRACRVMHQSVLATVGRN
jgi:hypothetical protein